MKKIGRIISLLMGFAMSLVMSVAGTLLSGHFTLLNFLISFGISFVISVIIGFSVPMKPLSDKVCEGFGAQPGTKR